MPALLELTSEANGYATSRPVTAASNPGATIRGPTCPGHGTRGAFLEHRTGHLAPSRRLRGCPFQKSTRSRDSIIETASSRGSQLKITCISRSLRLNNLERPPVPAGCLSNESNLPVLKIARECRARFRELLVGIAE